MLGSSSTGPTHFASPELRRLLLNLITVFVRSAFLGVCSRGRPRSGNNSSHQIYVRWEETEHRTTIRTQYVHFQTMDVFFVHWSRSQKRRQHTLKLQKSKTLLDGADLI